MSFMRGSLELLIPLIGSQKNLDKTIITEKVRSTTLKFSNNTAAGLVRIFVELVEYFPEDIHVFIQESLYHVLKSHQMLDTDKGSLFSLYKPGKLKGTVKNLRPAILLTML